MRYRRYPAAQGQLAEGIPSSASYTPRRYEPAYAEPSFHSQEQELISNTRFAREHFNSRRKGMRRKKGYDSLPSLLSASQRRHEKAITLPSRG
jgi:hypothetical protein